MNIEAYKINLLKKVLEEKDESTLKKINRILNKETEVVAHSTSGQPLNKLEYLRQIEKGANDIKEGKILSSTELSNRINSWTKS